eukprot:8246474-Pyramimonas_sp.AAC.1
MHFRLQFGRRFALRSKLQTRIRSPAITTPHDGKHVLGNGAGGARPDQLGANPSVVLTATK